MTKTLSLVCRAIVGGWTILAASAQVPTQAQVSIRPVPPGSVELTWPRSGDTFVVERTDSLTPPIAWGALPEAPAIQGDRVTATVAVGAGTQFFRLRQTVVDPVVVASTSPASGESGVAVTRETIFRLSGALAPDTELGTNQVVAIAGGRRVLSRLEMGADRRTVTLFYLERLPADTRVQVTFDGTGVFDSRNLPVDLDGDGVVGGAARLTFETLSTTALATTGIEGRVFASEKNPDGSDRPLRQVTITVDGMEETLRTTTDANGYFRLVPCPAGRFFVSVDGRTAEGSRWPGGAYYPFVGKAWEAAPGRTNNLAGGSGVVYLPLIPSDALQPVSATTGTRITFAPSVLATNPVLAGVEVSVPPNALFSDSGVRGGLVGIAPVPFDRLPEPLPPGLNLPLVITIQTDGPSNFDGPVPVTFPNLPDPVTGRRLGPGEKTALWSFNHDTGRWEIQGSMTISADGQFAVSDPGVGVRQPGWHGAAPGNSGGGPGGPGGPRRCPNPPCPDDDTEEEKKDPCDTHAALTFLSLNDLVMDFALEATGGASKDPIANCLFGSGINVMRTIRDCQLQDDQGCRSTMKNNYIGSALGCFPKVGGIASLGWSAAGLIDSVFGWYDCTQNQQGAGAALASAGASLPGSNPIAGVLANVVRELEDQIALSAAARRYLTGLYGSEVWSGPESPADAAVYTALFERIAAAQAESSPGGVLFAAEERAILEAAPLPARVTIAHLRALLDRFERIAHEDFVTDPVLRDEIRSATAQWLVVAEPLFARGWEHHFTGLERAVTLLSGLTSSGSYPGSGAIAGGSPSTRASAALAAAPAGPVMYRFPIRPLFFRLVNLTSGFESRGRLNTSASFEGLILAPETWYAIEYFDPVRRRLGSAHFRSGPSGGTTVVPAALLWDPVDPDRDGDGLTDASERILGTHLSRSDTDGDGLSDGAEIANATDPSDGQPLGLGVVATRRTGGNAVDLDTVNDYAVVANGSSGISVFQVGNPLAPVLVSQFTQTGRTFRTVATAGEFVAAIPASTTAAAAGIQVFGLGPDGTLLPRTLTLLGDVPEAVVASGRYAYVPARAGTNRSVAVVRLADTRVMRRVDVPGGVEPTALAIDGDVLWTLGSTQLASYRIEADNLIPLAQATFSALAPSPLESGPELAAGQGRVYVGDFRGFRIFDVTDPALPTLLAAPATTQAAIHDLALTGSGRMLPVTSFSGAGTLALALYDIQGDRPTNFLTSFDTPGNTRAAVLHRGYALAADDGSGLTTVNFLAADRGTLPPSIVLRPFPTHGAAGTEADELFHVSTVTRDDVQVRDVEFHIDGTPVALSGKHPFAASLRAPARTATRTTFQLRARATDTGGNSTWSDEVLIAILPDQTPPYVLSFSPPHNSIQPRGSVSSLTVQFDSAVDLTTLRNGWTLRAAGPDGNLGTPDDVAVDEGQIDFDPTTRLAARRFAAPLMSGKYRVFLAASVADLGGNPLGTPLTWDFTIPTPQPLRSDPPDAAVVLTGTRRRWEVTFDERLSPGSVTTTSLRLVTNNATNPLPLGGGSTSVAADGRTAVLEFAQPVADGNYRLVFTPSILDAYGSPVATNLPVAVTIKGPAVWVSDLDGLWQTGTNWSRGVPIAGDHVIIDRPGATPRVTLRTDATVTTLRSEEPFVLDGRTLTVRNRATFHGTFDWTNQTRLNGGTIEWHGGVVVSGTANKFLAGTTVRNGGIFDWRRGGLLFNFPDVEFHNLPGAVFLINKAGPPADTDGLVLNGPNATGLIRNDGTFRKAGGAETGFLHGMGFLNNGLIDVTHGALELGTVTTNAGIIRVAAGTRLIFGPSLRGGSLVQLPSGRITGEGSIGLEVNCSVDGDYDVDGTTTIAGTRARFTRTLRTRTLVVGGSSTSNNDLVLDDGGVVGSLTLGRRAIGSGVLRILNPGNHRNLSIGGSLVVQPEAEVQVTNSLRIGDRARWENRSVLRIGDGASFTAEDEAVLENLPGGVLHLIDDARLQSSPGLTSTQAFLHNAGWLRKSAGTNDARITGKFTNDGRLTVETGAVALDSTGVHTGAFETEAGTRLTFRDGFNEFTPASTFRGSGALAFTKQDTGTSRPLVAAIRGTLAVPRLSLTKVRLFLSGGRTLPALDVGGPEGSATLELDGDLSVSDELVLQAATFQPSTGTEAVTLRNQGTARATSLALPTGMTLENRPGAQFQLGTGVTVGTRALLQNLPGATFSVVGTNAQITTASIVSTNAIPGALWNEGTFQTAPNGTLRLTLNVTNTGLMELRPGALEVSNAQFFQMGGELRLTGGRLALTGNTFTERPPLVLAAGDVTGSGSIGFTASSRNTTVTNQGCTLKPGLPLGTLTFEQRLTLAPGSTVEIELAGTIPGTGHDQLVVAGPIHLDGTLRLRLRDDYIPAVGDEYRVATFSSRGSSTFATLEGLDIGGNKRLSVTHESTRILVRCVASP